MKATGGTLEDYVRLNADYSNVNENALLREYYKSSKPHLNEEEINFIIEDSFSIDEELELFSVRGIVFALHSLPTNNESHSVKFFAFFAFL